MKSDPEGVGGFNLISAPAEHRIKDMKISTLIEYLDNLGLSIEIKVYPKNKKKKNEEIVSSDLSNPA